MIKPADNIKEKIATEGFAIIEDVFTADEIDLMVKIISAADTSKTTFRKSRDLFAIRRFLKEIPETSEVIFNNRLKSIISGLFGDDYFVVKSIFFDKPEKSNWFVAYH